MPDDPAYRLEFTPRCVERLRRMDRVALCRVRDALERLCAPGSDPTSGANVKRLRGSLSTFYRLRVGDLRAAYSVDGDALVVLVVHVGTRGEFYDTLTRATGGS